MRAYIGLAMSLTLSLPPSAERDGDKLAEAAVHAERDKARVILTRDGKPVAAVVPIEDLESLEAEDEYWSRVAGEAVAEWEAAGRPLGPTLEELAARYGIALDPDLG
jgi:PHD/YefM family antitoxin component YafN of YafNO toxin-antitoxin module